MNGLIAVSCRPDQGRWIEVYQALEDMVRPDNWRLKYYTGWFSYVNKQQAVIDALNKDLDYIFFVDDDQILPPDTLIKLLKRQKEIISCNLISKVPPFYPFMFRDAKESGEAICLPFNENIKGVIEVDACGAGGLLVKTNVFKAAKLLDKELWGIDDIIRTEDLFFCREARALGFNIFVDLQAPSGHIAVAVVWPNKENGNWRTAILMNNDLKIDLPACANVGGTLTIPNVAKS